MTTSPDLAIEPSALDAYTDAYLVAGTWGGALLILWQEASREDWARRTVAAAGKSWDTHMAKFSGTVLRRTQPTMHGIRGHQVTTVEEDGIRQAAILAAPLLSKDAWPL